MIAMEAEFTTKQESSINPKISKASSSTTSSSSWSRLKDPRIVCVSRAFGGKDRHSKVCTVRGLKDRRVRLSVPTAIQLYNLQDRLGLNQPSKVVDWLLNAAKHGIDELPPLQIPHGSFSQHLQHLLASHHEHAAPQSAKQCPRISWNDPLESKAVVGETSNGDEGQRRLFNQLDNQLGAHVSANVLSRENPCFQFRGLHSSFLGWDSSNLSLSQPTPGLELTARPDQDLQDFSLLQLPSGPHHHDQVLVSQPAASTRPYSPPQIAALGTEFFPKQTNFQCSELSYSSLPSPVYHFDTQPAVRPFPFTMTADLLPLQKHSPIEQNRRIQFHS